MQNILSTKEAAEYCKMTYQDMVVLLRKKVIPTFRKGTAFLVEKKDLDIWLEQSK